LSLAPGTRLGPYEILAAIGAGGMGEVYRATDTRLDRDVAIKVLPAGSVGNEQAEARFDREARAIAGLSHPNICSLHDVGRHDDRSFLVMELLEGETLHQRLTREPLEVGALVDHAINLADALDAAHARGMLHRDLKPANLFLTSRGQIKILDFGLAKALESSDDATRVAEGPLTGDGTAVGTLGYMSPEQLRGETIDARSDLFALGAVLYEMATGKRAFQGSTGAVVSHGILGEHPAAPRTIRPELPVKLEETILKALEKDREVRCQTAAELRADLKRVKRDLPANVARPTPTASAGLDPGAPSASVSATTKTPAASTTAPASSDTQLVVGLVRRHRLAVLLSIVGIAGAIAGGFWLTNRGSSEPTLPSPATALQIQPLTLTGNTGLGALSPDGKFVAYLGREGRDNPDVAVWVRQLTTQSDVRIVPIVPGRRYVGLTVTPDGSYVDFIAAEKDVAQPDLWRVPFLGGTPRRIATGVWSATAWAPDGRHMAFIRSKADGVEESVVIADADGANERVLVTRRLPQRLYSHFTSAPTVARPSWSLDGRSLLVLGFSRDAERVSRGNDGSGRAPELVVLDVSTGAETRTVPLGRVLPLDTAWLDDQRALVNGVLPGKTAALFRADLATGALAPITQDLTMFFGVSLTADRQAVVTTRVEDRSGIWIGDGAGGAMTEIVSEGAAFAGSVALDRVGGLVYQAATTTGRGIFMIGPDQRAPSLVVDNGTRPKITSDGKTIVFQRGGDKPGLYRVNADGSGLSILDEGPAVGAIILPDDRTVLYLTSRNVVQSLWSVPLAGGPSREILPRLVYEGSVSASPDGRRLTFMASPVNGRPTPLMCDLPDCTNPRDLAVPFGPQWMPDGRGMAVYESTDTKNIWVQPFDGGARHPLTKFREKNIVDFAWSPDGKRLAITRRTRLADIVLIKGIK
jgi:eukaryotic-like serine/threonine-protein kinase